MALKFHLLTLLLLCLYCIALGQIKIIRAGKLFDSRSGNVVTNKAIFIEKNIVKEVKNDDGNYPAGAEVIDMSGKFVMPGLIDAHVHFFLHPYNETSWNDQVLKEDIPLRTLMAGEHAERTLKSGFTSVRDLGTEGAEYADKSLKDAIAKEIVKGPRYYIASKAIVITEGYGPKGYASHVHIPVGAETADGEDEIRKTVRSQLGHGADWIKLYGDYRRKDGKTSPTYTEEELRVAVQEAAAVGVHVSVHAYTPEAIKRAVRAGVKTIEHGSDADEETFKLMKSANVTWVPTLAAIEAIAGYSSGEQKAAYLKKLEMQKVTFNTALKAGVSIICGSDAGVFSHGENYMEVDLLIKHGMTPVQALQAATIKAAEVIDPSLKLGVIEPESLADIIAVDGDPLTRISDLKNIQLVVKDGVVIQL